MIGDRINARANHTPHHDQGLVGHLIELRTRLLRIVMWIGGIFLCLVPFAGELYTMLAEPLMATMPQGTHMIATEVASPFLTPFKFALVLAMFLGVPAILYQIWSFIAPGLYAHEKKMMLPLLVASSALFYLGVLFAYYVVFPLIFSFLIGIVPEGVSVMTDIARYLDFVLKLFFAFGIAFEIPIATILLVWSGTVTPDQLSSKRSYVVVGAFVLGMLLTPPDIISQTLLAVPMWLLFELGVFISRRIAKRKKPDDEEEEPAATEADPK